MLGALKYASLFKRIYNKFTSSSSYVNVAKIYHDWKISKTGVGKLEDASSEASLLAKGYDPLFSSPPLAD